MLLRRMFQHRKLQMHKYLRSQVNTMLGSQSHLFPFLLFKAKDEGPFLIRDGLHT